MYRRYYKKYYKSKNKFRTGYYYDSHDGFFRFYELKNGLFDGYDFGGKRFEKDISFKDVIDYLEIDNPRNHW